MYANRDIKNCNNAQQAGAISHTFRQDPDNGNVDEQRSIHNYVVLGANNKAEYQEQLQEKLDLTAEGRNNRKVRSDANLTINQIFNASPEYFYNFKKARMTRKRWQQLEWEKEEHRAEILRVFETLDMKKVKAYEQVIIEHLEECHKHTISLVCHLDEKTPHWHAVIVPVVENSQGVLKLSAKEYYRKKSLHEWNEDFQNRIKKLGLEFRKEAPDIPLAPEDYKILEQKKEPEKAKSRRKSAYEPKTNFIGFYSQEEVDKFAKSYENREINLKEIIANQSDWIEKNRDELTQMHNLQVRYDRAKKLLEEANKKAKSYRRLSASEAKLRKELEQYQEQNKHLKARLNKLNIYSDLELIEQVPQPEQQVPQPEQGATPLNPVPK